MHDFLVELQNEYEQIAQNQISRFQPGMTMDEVMAACEKNVEKRREFRRKTDRIIKETIYPLLDNIADIGEKEEAELFAAAQGLSSYTVRLDPGLAMKIYRGLLEWASGGKDDDKTIKYLYWCGITTYFFFRAQNHKIEQDELILSYFERGASYADRYYEFDDPETRQYIHRCLGNRSMMLYNLGKPERAMETEEENFSFWNSIMYAGKDQDFPWLSYFLACLNHRHGHMMTLAHTDPDSMTKAEQKAILDLAITINKLYKKNIDLFSAFGGTRYDFILWEAQFLSGLISFDMLYENVFLKKAEFADDDFSSDALFVKIQLNSYLMFYVAEMKKLRDKRTEVIEKLTKDSIAYFSIIPMSVSSSNLSEQLQFFARNLSDVFDPLEQVEFVMKMTTFRHIPTYAHSLMVGKISLFIARHLIENDPAFFIGCMGIKSAEEATRRAKEIISIVDTGSLCHDVGKITYISNSYMHTRILTDEEKDIIRRHPSDGAIMLERKDKDTAMNQAYIDIIRGHHKYYDNSEGYPEDFDTAESEYKQIIDIITIANAIDSATDGIGKTHADAKTADEIFDEIIECGGGRYCPVTAATLNDENVRDSLKKILDIDRKEAYYTAYLHAWSLDA